MTSDLASYRVEVDGSAENVEAVSGIEAARHVVVARALGRVVMTESCHRSGWHTVTTDKGHAVKAIAAVMYRPRFGGRLNYKRRGD